MCGSELDALLADAEGQRRSLLYWNELLDFYRKHRHELDEADIVTLYRRSEECRSYWNVDRVEVRKVRRPDGTVREVVTVRKGLGCRREEVATDLYAVAEGILRQGLRHPCASLPAPQRASARPRRVACQVAPGATT